MDFAGILAFSSKKRRMISSNNERRPSGYSLDGFFYPEMMRIRLGYPVFL